MKHLTLSQTYYVASTSTTERPVDNNEYDATNGIDDSIQQVYVLQPIVKPEITRLQKATLKPDYVQPHTHQKHKTYPNSVAQSVKIPSSTKIKYETYFVFFEMISAHTFAYLFN